MAAVIEAARSARVEAQRLRQEERKLRIDMCENRAIQKEMMRTAAAAAATATRERQRSRPSPWSTLLWQYEDAQLDQTLVPVG